MKKFLFKRLGQTLVVLFIISVLAFMLLHMLPGDPVYSMLGSDITQERHDQVWVEMGLDKPLVIQYCNWIGGIFVGDFGYSYGYRCPVGEILKEKLPITFYLGMISVILSVVLGVALGAVSAVKHNKWQDNVLTVLANIGLACPKFWLGVILVFFFSVKLKIFSTYGFEWPWVDFVKSVKTTVIPIICMSVTGISTYTRQTRSSMLEVISQDYIRTARSKGLSEKVIIKKHALKNALIPILTLVAVSLRGTIAGSAVIESLFNINGTGFVLVKAISLRDFQLVQTIVLILGVFTCLCNAIIDLAYAYVDPRVRLQ